MSRPSAIDFEVSCAGALLSCPACGAAVAAGARPAAPRVAASGLLPVRGLAARRCAARGLRRLRQDHATGRAVGARRARVSRLRSRPWRWPCAASCPVRQAAALLRCRDKRLWRRIAFYVDQARALESFEGVQIVGIDETSLRRGQHYITVVHDLDAKRLLFATEGRDHQTVRGLRRRPQGPRWRSGRRCATSAWT
ncbi:MAG: transposase [Comamonadaceae bacterium]|nr:transposase [Comamonadaceae bacterium]